MYIAAVLNLILSIINEIHTTVRHILHLVYSVTAHCSIYLLLSLIVPFVYPAMVKLQ